MDLLSTAAGISMILTESKCSNELFTSAIVGLSFSHTISVKICEVPTPGLNSQKFGYQSQCDDIT